MNTDDSSYDSEAIEPELEARIVAWVLGEASPFEAAELERLCAEKPELTIFKRRIEAVHGLAGEAAQPEKMQLRLTAGRRKQVLAAISDEESLAEKTPGKPRLVVHLGAWRRRWWVPALTGIAACVVVTLFLIPQFDRVRETARRTVAGTEARMREQEELLRQSMPPPTTVDESRPIPNGTVPVGPSSAAPPGSVAIIPGVPKRDLLTHERRRPMPDFSDRELYNRIDASSRSDLSRGNLQSTSNRFVTGGVGGENGANEPSPLTFLGRYETANRIHGSSDNPQNEVGRVVTLSPFSVEASEGQTGRYASSTLAGSRQKTRFGDLASSVNVATAQHLQDPSATSLNDVFMYDVSTEKVGNYDNHPTSDSDLLGNLSNTNGITVTRPGIPRLHPLRHISLHEVAGSRRRQLALAKQEIESHDAKHAEMSETDGDTKEKVVPANRVEHSLLSNESSAQAEPVSTFSLHVSDASYRIAQAALARGELPDLSRIRPEEFYNAFDYGDPAPAVAAKIACRIEQSAHPFLQQRNLVRLALRVPATGRSAGQPLRLTVLLDTSGSMERADRVAAVQRALNVLASLLDANDRVTLIGFARQPRLLVEQVSGDEAARLVELAATTPSEGGTNIEEALNLAGELARRQHHATAQNRIVLLTDGAANLGNDDPEQLATMIETLRQQDIAFDACGIGTEGLDDAILEALTRKGNGRYYVLDTAPDADAGFARQLAGAFRPAAENVKLQVRLNPARVGRYRLIGFEHHRLQEEDFRNDAVDAAELAAEEAAVALYQIEALPEGEGELGEVFARFHDAATGKMVERSWTMPYDSQTPAFERATPSLQLAGSAAMLAEKLRGGAMADAIRVEELAPTITALRHHYAHDPRVHAFAAMFEQWRRITGE